MTTQIKPSRVRSISPREAAFMLGEPIGDFHPEPMYLDNVEPLKADVPFTPDWSYTPVVGTVRCCETPDPERNCDRRDDQLFAWCVLAVVVAGYAALLGFALWMGTR
jgi:hypothetical protein